MIFDARNEFADAVALNTGGAGTYLVGSQVDLGAVSQDIGNGQPVYLVLEVDTPVTSDGSATVQFKLASDASAAIATDGSATEHIVTPAIPKATLVAGYKRVIPLPLGTYERFLGILQVTGTAALTAGKINAFLTLDPTGWVAYPDAL